MKIIEKKINDNESKYHALDESGELQAEAHLMKFQPGVFGVVARKIHVPDDYSQLFSQLFSHIIKLCKDKQARLLEYRAEKSDFYNLEKAALEKLGFKSIYDRLEFKKAVDELPGDQDSPLSWRSLPDLSESHKQKFAQLMKACAVGDPDFSPDDDAYECINGYLTEEGLTALPECFHMASIDGIDVGYVIGQIDPSSGWSRITYMGILPEYRGKGYGKWIHRHGFQVLKDLGGKTYHGGTLAENKAMVALFRSHDCEPFRTLQGWEIKFANT